MGGRVYIAIVNVATPVWKDGVQVATGRRQSFRHPVI